MKIALIQQHSTKDKNDNIERELKAVEEAASKGTELIAFPELSFDFFYPQYPDYREAFDSAESIPGPTTDLFSKKAKELQTVLVINLFERDGENTYDTSIIINRKGRSSHFCWRIFCYRPGGKNNCKSSCVRRLHPLCRYRF